MKYQIPILKCFSGSKIVFFHHVNSHATHKGIDYIDIFFPLGMSILMVEYKVTKIVIDDIFVGKNKYKISLKIKLPKKFKNHQLISIISFKFFRKTKRSCFSIPSQNINEIYISKNTVLGIE